MKEPWETAIHLSFYNMRYFVLIFQVFLISVNCVWSDWKIGDCSVSCGLGTRTETRKKTVIEQNGGECIGEASVTSECHDEICPG